jgi:hypothetical protein
MYECFVGNLLATERCRSEQLHLISCRTRVHGLSKPFSVCSVHWSLPQQLYYIIIKLPDQAIASTPSAPQLYYNSLLEATVGAPQPTATLD